MSHSYFLYVNLMHDFFFRVIFFRHRRIVFLAFKLSVSVSLTALPSLSGLSLLTQCLSWRSGFFLTPLLNNIPLHNVLKNLYFHAHFRVSKDWTENMPGQLQSNVCTCMAIKVFQHLILAYLEVCTYWTTAVQITKQQPY